MNQQFCEDVKIWQLKSFKGEKVKKCIVMFFNVKNNPFQRNSVGVYTSVKKHDFGTRKKSYSSWRRKNKQDLRKQKEKMSVQKSILKVCIL